MKPIARRRAFHLLVVGAALPLWAGCGQKGSLYLPPEDGEGSGDEADAPSKTSAAEPPRAPPPPA